MIGEPKIKKRKVIQISTSVYQGVMVVALCDDGTMWTNDGNYVPIVGNSEKWVQIKNVPDDDSKLKEEESEVI